MKTASILVLNFVVASTPVDAHGEKYVEYHSYREVVENGFAFNPGYDALVKLSKKEIFYTATNVEKKTNGQFFLKIQIQFMKFIKVNC